MESLFNLAFDIARINLSKQSKQYTGGEDDRRCYHTEAYHLPYSECEMREMSSSRFLMAQRFSYVEPRRNILIPLHSFA